MPRPRRPPDRANRSLIVAIVVSVAAHLLLGWGLGTGRLAVVAAPDPATPPPPRPPVRFELVDTPASAATDEPTRADRISTRSTRAQDRAATEAPLGDPQVTVAERTRAGEAASPLAPPRPAAPPPTKAPAKAAPSAAEPPQDAGTVRAGAPRPDRTGEAAEATPPSPAPAPASPSRPATPAEAAELSRAAAEGEFSYEATQHFFAEYLLALRQAVQNQWYLGLMGRSAPRFGDHRAVVDFSVLPDGRIGTLRLAEKEGDDTFAALSVRAIRDASPFGPVPYERLPGGPGPAEGLPLRIRFTFEYR